MAAKTVKETLVYAPGGEFLLPYLERTLGHRLSPANPTPCVTRFISGEDNGEADTNTATETANGASTAAASAAVDDASASAAPTQRKCAIMISSTDVYNVRGGENLTEETPLLAGSEWLRREENFRSSCGFENIPTVIIRCPHIVGTGMNGLPMRIARGINNGILCHIRGNDAAVSVVHAVDIAALAAILGDKLLAGAVVPAAMNFTDGTRTTVNALIEALAYRMGNKRIYTIGPKIARLIYGKEFFGQMTETLTFDDALAIAASDGMRLHPVTEYLTTHVYDGNSL